MHKKRPTSQLRAGIRLHKAGNLLEAAKSYRQVLSVDPKQPDALHLLGVIAHAGGKYDDAVNLISQSLRINPANVDALNDLAGIVQGRGGLSQAAELYNIAIAAAPKGDHLYSNRGDVLRRLGRFEEAQESFSSALKLNPNSRWALGNLGTLYVEMESYAEAEACFRRALAANPGLPQAHCNLGVALKLQGKYAEADECFHCALVLQPKYAPAHVDLGASLKAQGRLAEAIQSYWRALEINPRSDLALTNLGNALMEQGEYTDALGCLQKAVSLNPASHFAQNNLGSALIDLNRSGEAVSYVRRALEIRPQYAQAHNNLGTALLALGRAAEAVDCFRRALQITPGLVESHWDLAFTLLLKGDFLSGWDEYEWRWQRKDHPARSFDMPAWQGENLAGKRLLIYAEQGAGDTIQFARYVPLLAQRGARVILECPRALVALLGTLPGVERVIAKGDRLPPADFQCALLSLPRWFGTTQETIPSQVPYLQARSDGPRLPAFGPSPDGRSLRVGFVWSGNPEHQNDARRSIALEVLRPWLANQEAVFHSLQPKPASGAGKPPQIDDLVTDLTDLIGDYADTACLVRQLDLVIAVDTSVAHLAGALGHPVWLLLPYAPDWRWLMDRHDSPWYPSMTIFRQPVAGDWSSVLRAVSENLRRPPKAAKKPSPE